MIALGSDVDGIPRASQMPGVAFRQPMIEGAPGHGEGHNSGQAVNIVAALAVKEIMESKRLPGTIVIWPGIAEELLGTKAWYARDGLLRGSRCGFYSPTYLTISQSVGDEHEVPVWYPLSISLTELPHMALATPGKDEALSMRSN